MSSYRRHSMPTFPWPLYADLEATTHSGPRHRPPARPDQRRLRSKISHIQRRPHCCGNKLFTTTARMLTIAAHNAQGAHRRSHINHKIRQTRRESEFDRHSTPFGTAALLAAHKLPHSHSSLLRFSRPAHWLSASSASSSSSRSEPRPPSAEAHNRAASLAARRLLVERRVLAGEVCVAPFVATEA